MYDGCGAGYGWAGLQECGMGPNGDLEGFWDVVAAPFKGAYKVGKFAVTRAPTFVAGTIGSGGNPLGGAAAVAAREFTRSGGSRAPAGGRYTSRYGVNTPGIFPQSDPFFQPTTTYAGGAPNLNQMAQDILAQLKTAAGRAIAQTPEGRAGIAEEMRNRGMEAAGTAGKYLLPAAVIGIPLLIFAMKR